MKRAILLSIAIVFIAHCTHSQVVVKKKEIYRQILVAKTDTLIKFGVCRPDIKFRCKDDFKYYWYEKNNIHCNRGTYEGCIIHGNVSTYDLNGNLMEKGKMTYGLKSGIWIKWHKNGEWAEVSKYVNSEKHGIETIYDRNGNTVSKHRYRHGTPSKKIIKYEQGKKIKEKKVKSKRGKEQKKLKYDILDGKGNKKKKNTDKEKKEFYEFIKDLFRSGNEKKEQIS